MGFVNTHGGNNFRMVVNEMLAACFWVQISLSVCVTFMTSISAAANIPDKIHNTSDI